ncbi:corticotropin releasing hormone b [Electrophorus electricus]|uniref:Corticotropin-releasing factor domain-containing protein n=1 Tax=Electrophorus electricus TaxID=8005 RepID=A0A4W4FD70_ELEEL|nr:corticotropin releasing hormone b [Electrophorus electricus]
MKLNFLITTVVLLVAFLPRYECRAIDGSSQQVAELDPPQQTQPILARLGAEYFIRLGNKNKNNHRAPSDMHLDSSLAVSKRALQLQLTQRLLEGKVGNIGRFVSYAHQPDDSTDRERRSEEPPISLDLTFHLLREVLEMARAEQLAQQAHSNRKMMEIFGK